MTGPRRSARIIDSQPPPSAGLRSRTPTPTKEEQASQGSEPKAADSLPTPGRDKKHQTTDDALDRAVAMVKQKQDRVDQAMAKVKQQQEKVSRMQIERDNLWPSIKAHEAAIKQHQRVMISSRLNLTRRNKDTDLCEEHEAQLDDELNSFWKLQKGIDHAAGVVAKLLGEQYKIEKQPA
ncbi:hypothetical protein ACHAPQ_003919 [Fusarium lateritium]